MTDQVEQDLELDDIEIEEAHDPKNAEQQSVASVDKAGEATKKAPARKGDKSNAEPMPKTKAGIINAMFSKMNNMKTEDLKAMYTGLGEAVESAEDAVSKEQVEISVDFSEDLNALVESEATLSEEFKDKAGLIFEAAIKSKLAEEIDRLETQYNEELAEELARSQGELVEKVDSYLNYVVENWMTENKMAIQAGLRTEIAENFIAGMKDLFTESYITVPDEKVDLVDELAEHVESLESELNSATAHTMSVLEELETLRREKVIREASRDLADTQAEKLNDLAEKIDFDSVEDFKKKIATLKESYFGNKSNPAEDISDELAEDPSENAQIHNDVMQSYLSALKKTQK